MASGNPTASPCSTRCLLSSCLQGSNRNSESLSDLSRFALDNQQCSSPGYDTLNVMYLMAMPCFGFDSGAWTGVKVGVCHTRVLVQFVLCEYPLPGGWSPPLPRSGGWASGWLAFRTFLLASLTRKDPGKSTILASKERFPDAKPSPTQILIQIFCHHSELCWSSGQLGRVGAVLLNQGRP